MNAPPLFPGMASLAAAALLASSAPAQTTTRVSVSSSGEQADHESRSPAVSRDGRFVAFSSFASNLVPGDTNARLDVFVHDRQAGTTRRVNVDSAGSQANLGGGGYVGVSLSADGRYVAFDSYSTNLVPGDTNDCQDVFVHDLHTGQTTRVSVDSAGAEGNSHSVTPALSADGRYVAYHGTSTNLVPGDLNGAHSDVFVHDRITGLTTRVSVNSAGVQANLSSVGAVISSDGRVVAFSSDATNLVAADANGCRDVFVHDRQSGTTIRASVDSAGAEGNLRSGEDWHISISGDGRHVAFHSEAFNLVTGDTNGDLDCFVHDLQTGQTSRISVDSAGVEGNGPSAAPFISDSGRFVSFGSNAANLVPGDTNGSYDIMVHDRLTGRTSRASLDFAGRQSGSWSGYSSLSADGRVVAFLSYATLVTGDTNGTHDVFVRDQGAIGPNLARAGSCPGSVNLTISQASPFGRIAIACGTAGTFARVMPPCAGLALGVSPPARTRIVFADVDGIAILDFILPAGFCGLSAQAVDVTTCSATNVIVL